MFTNMMEVWDAFRELARGRTTWDIQRLVGELQALGLHKCADVEMQTLADLVDDMRAESGEVELGEDDTQH
jgi:hypothetical protein